MEAQFYDKNRSIQKTRIKKFSDFGMRFIIVLRFWFASYLELPQRSTSGISLSERFRIFESNFANSSKKVDIRF